MRQREAPVRHSRAPTGGVAPAAARTVFTGVIAHDGARMLCHPSHDLMDCMPGAEIVGSVRRNGASGARGVDRAGVASIG